MSWGAFSSTLLNKKNDQCCKAASLGDVARCFEEEATFDHACLLLPPPGETQNHLRKRVLYFHVLLPSFSFMVHSLWSSQFFV